MRSIALSLLAPALLCGCMTLHADIPEEAVRHHLAREEGVVLAASCSHEGKRFSEGASACMTGRRMICDETGRWAQDGDC